MFESLRVRIAAHVLAGLTIPSCSAAQLPRQYTTQDYAAAEKFMPYFVDPLAYKGVIKPHWLDDNRFWYRAVDQGGASYVWLDPAKGTHGPMFDQERIAILLEAASNGAIKKDPRHLQLHDISLSDNDREVTFTARNVVYRCQLGVAPESCKALSRDDFWPVGTDFHPPLTLSPDKKLGAFIRDWNLWVRDLGTGAETQLTTDGIKDYGYATDNAGWKQSDSAILVWSPDGARIATFQLDQRKTGDMYLVPVTGGHPELKAWKYPFVGDDNVTMIERVIIDVKARTLVRLKMPPDHHRSTLCDDIACEGNTFSDVQWSSDGSHVAFVSTARDHKQEWLRVADAVTGEVRDVMTETDPKFLTSGITGICWRYLSASNEVLWYSERDDWGNLYLYDLASGKMKNQVTHGPGNVAEVLRIDEKSRTVYFIGVGRESGRDPYFRHLYSVRFDGTNPRILTPEEADHNIQLSPGGRYFVDAYSTRTEPAITVVRDLEGKTAFEAGRQDIAPLLATGWKPPIPFNLKGRDGATDIYGFMYKPTMLDLNKKYPIVDFIYPGPQGKSCEGRGFDPGYAGLQSLAELGFVVVCIDGMGTEWRSKSFHAAYYGNLEDNGLPDQIAVITELARRYAFVDIARVGIFGGSGGGYAATQAMFRYPDFFKVGVSESGNHDNRIYEDDWGEKWAGLERKKPDGTSNYDAQANQTIAKNLKGHLLLTHGTMDDNVPPNSTLLVVDALIKANKDFDLILFPNAPHGSGAGFLYFIRRRWDYFVRYLAGGIPPPEYQMKSVPEVMQIFSNGPRTDLDSLQVGPGFVAP